MKAKFMGKSDPLGLLNEKIYEILSIEKGPGNTDWYRVIDETGDDYLYFSESFEIVEDEEDESV